MSARNLSRRVCFFLPAYSASAKLPCRCIDPPLPEPGRFYPIHHPKRDYFSISLGGDGLATIRQFHPRAPSRACWPSLMRKTTSTRDVTLSNPLPARHKELKDQPEHHGARQVAARDRLDGIGAKRPAIDLIHDSNLRPCKPPITGIANTVRTKLGLENSCPQPRSPVQSVLMLMRNALLARRRSDDFPSAVFTLWNPELRKGGSHEGDCRGGGLAFHGGISSGSGGRRRMSKRRGRRGGRGPPRRQPRGRRGRGGVPPWGGFRPQKK